MLSWDCSHQAPLSMGFSRPEYWSGLPLFFFGGSSQPRVQTRVSWVSRIRRWILYHSTTWEVLTMVRYQHRKLCGLILNKLLISSTLGDCRIPQGIWCLSLERIKLICLIDAGWAMPCFRRWNRSDVIYHFWTEGFFFFFCSEFCHTLRWKSHGFTCVPHPDPPEQKF